ncbi:hypothetical protein [Streptomyces reniochalinae]
MKNETVKIPGTNLEVTRTVAVPVDADENTNDGESEDVAKTMTKDQQNETANEIRADFERLTALVHEGNEEGLSTLKEEIRTKTESITGTGAAAVKAKLRAEAEKAESSAREAAKATESKEVATLETQDYRTEVADAEEIVTAAAQRIGEALTASMKVSDLAKEIAATKMRIAARITDKNGDPDVFLKTAQAKQASRDMYELAVKDMPETFESTNALKKLIKAVQNQQSDARTKYVRALDENPEEAKLFVRALEANPEAKPSDAVFDFHKIDRKSRQEKELENWHRSRGELTTGEGEGDESGEGDGSGGEGDGSGKVRATSRTPTPPPLRPLPLPSRP